MGTGTISEQAALAVTPDFQARVRAAMTAAAASIAEIAQGSQGASTYALRTTLALSVMQDATRHLERFSWAVATNAAVVNDMYEPSEIQGTDAILPATIRTISPHNLATGDIVEITGALDAGLNGTWIVTVSSAQKFSIPTAGVTFSAQGGLVCKQPADASIQTAVNTVWNPIAGVTAATV